MAGPRAPRTPYPRGVAAPPKERRDPLSPFGRSRGPTLPKLPNVGNYATSRGPRYIKTAPHDPWLPVPGYWGQRSELEWIVFWVLTKVLRKYPTLAPPGYPGPFGEDFSYQAAFEGGRVQYGGIVVDFVMEDGSQIAINPLGFHWHEGFGTAQQARDISAKGDLLGKYGILLIFIDEAPLREAPVSMVKDALAGVDHTQYATRG